MFRTLTRVTMMAGAVASLVGASVARADGPCYKDFRDTTPAERATMTAILETVKKALPPAPTGWVILGDEQVSVPRSLCRDFELSPLGYGFTRNYQRVDDQEARDKIIEEAGAKSKAAMDLKQPRLDAIMARMEKLSQRQVALVEKGDLAGAAALGDDMDKIQQEYQKVIDEGDSEQQFQEAAERAGRDVVMTVSLEVNAGRASKMSDAITLPLPPGAKSALRWTTTGANSTGGGAQILLGLWRTAPTGGWVSMSRANHPLAAAHTMAINVNADASRIESAVGAIDFNALAKLLPK